MQYTDIKKVMIDNNIFIPNNSITSIVSQSFSVIGNVSNDAMNKIRENINKCKKIDSLYYQVIESFKKNNKCSVRSFETDLDINQSAKTTGVIDIVSFSKSNEMSMFFSALNSYMNSIKSKVKKPSKLSINSKLEELRRLREEAMKKLNMSNDKTESLEKNNTLTLKSNNNYGYLNKGSLFIILSIAMCFIEYIFLIICR